MPTTDHTAAAYELDRADALAGFRAEFCLPRAGDLRRAAGVSAAADALRVDDNEPAIYLTGNSLGLQPVSTRAELMQELDDWAKLGVEGHFHAKHPWFPAHEELRGGLARLVGAHEDEVVAMNSLTTNLHLLMVSFYRPTKERFKIIMEDSAFPSDSYAIQTQAAFHARLAGFDAGRAVVRLAAKDTKTGVFTTQEILESIDRHASESALLLLGGVNYRTGQLFDMAAITAHARARGLVVGWDLAHAAGNVPLRLHDWGADFAAWCSYKYLNSGPARWPARSCTDDTWATQRCPVSRAGGATTPTHASAWGPSSCPLRARTHGAFRTRRSCRSPRSGPRCVSLTRQGLPRSGKSPSN